MKAVSAIFFITTMFLSSLWIGCNTPSSTSPITRKGISLSSIYSTAPAISRSMIPKMNVAGGSSSIDSIRISRARFVLLNVELKHATDSLRSEGDSVDFNPAPIVMDINLLLGVTTLAVTDAPLGTYNRVDMEIDKVDSAEVNSLPLAERAKFKDFLTAGGSYSIIIEGKVYVSGRDTSFAFRSRIDVEMRFPLSPPLVISETKPSINVTILVSSGRWFKSASGAFLDPRDPANEATISENLRVSLQPFEDDDKDGNPDGH